MLPDEITTRLRRERVDFGLLPHERSETACGEAVALGVAPAEVAKTVVLDTPAGYVRVIVPASARVDLDKVRRVVGGGRRTHVASEDDLARDYPEFEVGAVPPFGGLQNDPVVIDRSLLDAERVVFGAGTHTESVRISTQDLVWLTGARVVSVVEP
jgi:Ala-tRNA(Pro) deacylase